MINNREEDYIVIGHFAHVAGEYYWTDDILYDDNYPTDEYTLRQWSKVRRELNQSMEWGDNEKDWLTARKTNRVLILAMLVRQGMYVKDILSDLPNVPILASFAGDYIYENPDFPDKMEVLDILSKSKGAVSNCQVARLAPIDSKPFKRVSRIDDQVIQRKVRQRLAENIKL